ncbi:MAG: membrane dipeptidase [Acidimicrobiales bacterium]
MTSSGRPDPHSVERAMNLLAERGALDFHTHLGLWEVRGLAPDLYPGDDGLATIIDQMLAAGCRSASINLTSDIPVMKMGAPGNRLRDYEPGEAWAEYQRMLSQLATLCEMMPLTVARSVADLERIHDAGRLAVLLSIEGAHMVEDDLSRIAILASDGITKFQPIHYVRTKLGDSQTDPPADGGLSDLGKEAVRLARANGMVIDAAHASLASTADMAEAAGGPITLSHTLMACAAAHGIDVEPHPRWITEEHARMVAETGGMVGTWAVDAPFGAADADAFVANVMAMVEVAGIDHVGWATDHLHFAMGPWFRDYSQFAELCARFLEAGMSEPDLVKFVSGNAKRVQEEARTNSER